MDDTNQMAGRSNVCGFQEEGCLPIHMACMDVEENPNRLRRLIDMTSDVDARTENGLTALHIACGFGKYHLVRVLIEAGADVNARDKTDSTPLHFAVQGSNGAIKLLVEAGADVEAENAEKQTPLLLACTIGKVGAIENLCERGANVHLKTPAGVGLVFLVLDSRKSSMPSNAQAMTKALFARGASVGYVDGNGRSEIHVVAMLIASQLVRSKQYYAIFKKILKLGGNPWVKDASGKTAFHHLNAADVAELQPALKSFLKGREQEVLEMIDSTVALEAFANSQSKYSRESLADRLMPEVIR